MNNRNKRGQETFGLSFGMMFSMFLIVVFIVIAFIAIRHFLNLGQTVSVGDFYKDLQEEITSAWRAQSVEKTFTPDLPSEIRRICFANLSAPNINRNSPEYGEIEQYELYGANTFLLPGGKTNGMEFKVIEHLNIEKITESQNPYCVDATSQLKIKKDFYDKLVIIE